MLKPWKQKSSWQIDDDFQSHLDEKEMHLMSTFILRWAFFYIYIYCSNEINEIFACFCSLSLKRYWEREFLFYFLYFKPLDMILNGRFLLDSEVQWFRYKQNIFHIAIATQVTLTSVYSVFFFRIFHIYSLHSIVVAFFDAKCSNREIFHSHNSVCSDSCSHCRLSDVSHRKNELKLKVI